jgi:hypothetical protein
MILSLLFGVLIGVALGLTGGGGSVFALPLRRAVAMCCPAGLITNCAVNDLGLFWWVELKIDSRTESLSGDSAPVKIQPGLRRTADPHGLALY